MGSHSLVDDDMISYKESLHELEVSRDMLSRAKHEKDRARAMFHQFREEWEHQRKLLETELNGLKVGGIIQAHLITHVMATAWSPIFIALPIHAHQCQAHASPSHIYPSVHISLTHTFFHIHCIISVSCHVYDVI